MAQSTAYASANTPTTGFNGTATNPQDAYSSNDQYATFVADANPRNDEYAHNWRGFATTFASIPDGSTINSVHVHVEHKLSTNWSQGEIRMSVWPDVTAAAALAPGVTGAIGPDLQYSHSTATGYLSDTDWDVTLTGTLPTLAQLKGTNFGVRVQHSQGNNGTTGLTTSIDAIWIVVDYTAGSSTQTGDYTADATFLDTIQGSLSADAAFLDTIQASTSADATVLDTQQESFSADAVIGRTWASGGGSVASDTFTRTVPIDTGWGGNWTFDSSNTGCGVDGTTGYYTNASSASRLAVIGVDVLDVDVYYDFLVEDLPAVGQSYQFYTCARYVDIDNQYRPRFIVRGTDGDIVCRTSKIVATVASDIGSQTATRITSVAADTWYRTRVRFSGTSPTTIDMKVWLASEPEPSDWDLSGDTDSESVLQVAGDVGIRLLPSVSYLTTGHVDNFEAKTPSFEPFYVDATVIKVITPTGFSADAVITATIEPTGFSADAYIATEAVTGDFTADATFLDTIEGSFSADAVIKDTRVFGPGGGGTVAQDSFTQGGTGSAPITTHTAETGGTWSTAWSSGGTTWTIDQDNDRAETNTTTGSAAAYLPSTALADGSLTVDSLNTTQTAGPAARFVATDTFYAAEVENDSSEASQTLWVYRVTSGSKVSVASVGISGTATDGVAPYVRFDVAGSSPTSLKAKGWTGTEPGAWAIDTTDNTAGNQSASALPVGIIGERSSTGGPGTLDNLLVTSSGTPSDGPGLTVDASVVVVGQGDFTADAASLATLENSFSADAAFLDTTENSFSADATALATVEPTGFTADAFVTGPTTGDFSADAAFLDTQADAFSADATTLATFSPTGIAADANITATVEPTGFTADAEIHFPGGSFTADATVASVGGAPTWTTPADGVGISATPTLAFTMPDLGKAIHFDMQLDKVATFDGVDFREYKSNFDQTGWEYYDGGGWQAVPATGVPSAYAGNEARYTISDPLSSGTWYRRVRAG